MVEKEMLLQRLRNQQLSQKSFENVSDLVSWMGAVQAQDYVMSKWALGLRIKNSTDKVIEEAIGSGSILRTHVLRPTWHFVAAADIRWMLELSAPRIFSQMAYYDRQLEIDQKEVMKSIKLLEKTLTGQKQLTRPELEIIFTRSKFNCEGMRFGHLLMHAELRGIICSGARKGKHNTYALLEERISVTKNISKNESLIRLAQKYFQSHGPATLKDFIWWSGLTAKDSGEAIILLEKKITTIKVKEENYFYIESGEKLKAVNSVYLLPNYDEYTVAYSNREALMNNDIKGMVSRGGNPLFSNVVLVNGKIAGTWKREVKAKTIDISFDFYDDISSSKQKQISVAQKAFKTFLGYEE